MSGHRTVRDALGSCGISKLVLLGFTNELHSSRFYLEEEAGGFKHDSMRLMVCFYFFFLFLQVKPWALQTFIPL